MFLKQLCVLIVLAVQSVLSKPAKKVCGIRSSNELQKVLEESPVFALFYQPWCGFCKQFKPIFEEAAEQYKQSRNNVKFAEINCTDHEELCQENNVRSYPTIKLYTKDGGVVNYEDERTTDRVAAFLDSNLS